MLEMCKALYNIAIDVECENDYVNSNFCLCPDCDSFMQMCYLCNSKGKSNGLSCKEMKTADGDFLKCFRDQKESELCQNIKCSGSKVVDMNLNGVAAKCKWNKLTHLHRDDQENLLFLLTLLMTMEMVFQDGNIGLADLICAYDAEVLERRFDRMVYKFIQDVMNEGFNGKKESTWVKPEKDLSLITEFLENLNIIYLQREKVFNQAENYLCALYRGMEKENGDLDWKSSIRLDISTRLKKDSLGEDLSLETFLLSCLQSSENIKDSFYNDVIIMKTYLVKCQEHYQGFSQESVNTLLDKLDAFSCGGKTLNHIRGLERAAFKVRESFKADSKLILDYFRKVDIMSRVQAIMVHKECWNTWEMVS